MFACGLSKYLLVCFLFIYGVPFVVSIHSVRVRYEKVFSVEFLFVRYFGWAAAVADGWKWMNLPDAKFGEAAKWNKFYQKRFCLVIFSAEFDCCVSVVNYFQPVRNTSLNTIRFGNINNRTTKALCFSTNDKHKHNRTHSCLRSLLICDGKILYASLQLLQTQLSHTMHAQAHASSFVLFIFA